jgi:hypothetical protein
LEGSDVHVYSVIFDICNNVVREKVTSVSSHECAYFVGMVDWATSGLLRRKIRHAQRICGSLEIIFQPLRDV